MTHTSTEQERAEFEAAYVAEKLRILDSEGSADGEKAIRAVMLRRNANGDYDNSLEAHFAWWAWKAARRAPVGTTGWKLVPDEVPDEMVDAAIEAYMPFGDMRFAIVAALAAAPQPPQTDHIPDAGKMAAKHCDLCKSNGGYYYGKSGNEPCCV